MIMDDEDEIQSQPPNPQPHPNGHLSLAAQPVTIAAAPPPQHTLTLALPIQQSRTTTGGGGGGGGGREDCWSDGATSTLIDAWGERYLELSRGNLKQKHWQDVADIVSSREDYMKPPKTDVQCKNRIDTLKKKYKVEKAKILSGHGPSRWNFFNRLDRLIGSNTKITAAVVANPNSNPTPAAPMPTTPVLGAKVPVAIPVGLRTFHNSHHQRQQQQHRFRKSDSSESESEPAADSPESSDSFPPETTFNRKRPPPEKQLNSGTVKQKTARTQNVGKGNNTWGNSIRELTQAILEFGESYERAESSKLQQVVEMEKQRMEFAKELELQRMHFFMKTQLELTQLKHGRRGASSHRHHHHNSNNNRNKNSD